jgi:formylglycine-generating enzyme required for sulfatase activity
MRSLFAFMVLLVSIPLAWGEGRKIALVVGVRTYLHKTLKDLDYPCQDAAELAEVLRQADFASVAVMTSDAPNNNEKPTFQNMNRQIQTILKGIGKDDILLIALSGHGQENDNNENFFCPYDANPFTYERCIPLQKLLDQMHQSGVGSSLLLVDACRDEAKLPRGAKGASGDSILNVPEGVSALFSCARDQRSWEAKEAGGGHGIFFYSVIEALRGEAANKKGEVTWDRLVTHVKEQVPDRVTDWVGPRFRQIPHSVGNQVGAVILAKHAPAGERMRRPTSDPSSDRSSTSKSITSQTTGARLLLIPAGEFMMGSPDSDTDAESDEKPQHRVVLSQPFYLGETEVTQKQWKLVMGTEPWKGKAFVKEGDDYPATHVSWEDAVEYCKRLSAKDGRTYRLPTEAEWEYACRAGTRTKWSFGDSADELNAYGWWGGFSDGNAKTEQYAHRVGQKKPNGWGLRDMHGNVWEWCSDRYGEDYYKSSPGEDPSGPSEGSDRVFRGGSWNFAPVYTRSANRGWNSPGDRFDYLGFRLASSSVE